MKKSSSLLVAPFGTNWLPDKPSEPGYSALNASVGRNSASLINYVINDLLLLSNTPEVV